MALEHTCQTSLLFSKTFSQLSWWVLPFLTSIYCNLKSGSGSANPYSASPTYASNSALDYSQFTSSWWDSRNIGFGEQPDDSYEQSVLLVPLYFSMLAGHIFLEIDGQSRLKVEVHQHKDHHPLNLCLEWHILHTQSGIRHLSKHTRLETAVESINKNISY